MESIITVICSCAGIIIALFGAVFGLIQWRESCAIKRCEYNDKLLSELRNNKEFADMRYEFEYDSNWYTEDFHDSENGLEEKFDNYFLFLNYICFLYNTKRIKKNEFRIFEYLVIQVCNNPDAQKYFKFIFHYSKENNAACSFEEIIKFAIKKKIIKKTFLIDAENAYQKILKK